MIETNINNGSRYWFPQKLYVHDGTQYRDVKRMFVYDETLGWKECFRNLLTTIAQPSSPYNNWITPYIMWCNGYHYTLKATYSGGRYYYDLYRLNLTNKTWEIAYSLQNRAARLCSVAGNILYLQLYRGTYPSGTYAYYSFDGTTLTLIRDAYTYDWICLMCGSDLFSLGSGVAMWWDTVDNRWESTGTQFQHWYNVGGALFASRLYGGYLEIQQWNGGTSWSLFGQRLASSSGTAWPQYVNGYWYVGGLGNTNRIRRQNGGNWTEVGPTYPANYFNTICSFGSKILVSGTYRNGGDDGTLYSLFDTSDQTSRLISLRSTSDQVWPAWGDQERYANSHIDGTNGYLICIKSDQTSEYVWDGDLP